MVVSFEAKRHLWEEVGEYRKSIKRRNRDKIEDGEADIEYTEGSKNRESVTINKVHDT